jgi:hypothetical protein
MADAAQASARCPIRVLGFAPVPALPPPATGVTIVPSELVTAS